MIFNMLPVLLMRHYDNPLHLEKVHSDRPMHHSFIWCAYGAWHGPNLITGRIHYKIAADTFITVK